jgi:hypothetical protein
MSRKRNKQPELTFQQHIVDFLVRVHGYGVLEQTDIKRIEGQVLTSFSSRGFQRRCKFTLQFCNVEELKTLVVLE